MSIVAFKKKSVIQYGSKRSGVPPGGNWIVAGVRMGNPAPAGGVGFSLEGSHRNVGYIGKTSLMSKTGTPFRGQYPCWTSGGAASGNQYKITAVMNSNEVNVLGTQGWYVKPSVLSTRGMLRKRFKWVYNGQYPNYWVQPNYTGNLTDTASQGNYIQSLSAANDCVNDVNQPAKYEGNIACGGPTLCYNTPARFKFNDMASNAPYTKTITQPLTSSQQTLRIQRRCSQPVGAQKPFPFAVNGGSTGIGGIGGISGGNSGICTIPRSEYLTPPEWYTNPEPGNAPVES
jgi:hypothetical protein